MKDQTKDIATTKKNEPNNTTDSTSVLPEMFGGVAHRQVGWRQYQNRGYAEIIPNTLLVLPSNRNGTVRTVEVCKLERASAGMCRGRTQLTVTETGDTPC